jgi:nucleotide-binding universal stress UspA family protein
MTSWKRIACAVDYSEPSRAALEQAAEVARQHRAELVIVHVYEPPPDAAENFLAPLPDSVEARKREEEVLLAAWRADAERLTGFPVTTAILIGSPAAELVRFAREREIDLLVVATHGRRGLAHLVMGSVAERVVREAPCSILVARAGA